MNPKAVLIFAKHPVPGKAKTRMSPALSPEEAAELSHCFIRDTLRAARKVRDADCYLFYTPQNAGTFFRKIAPKEWILIPQEGENLTARCLHSVREAFNRGHSGVVQIGTDTPQIRPEDIERGFDLLLEYDMGFGPTNDGGYYLLSLARPETGIYDGVIMGSDTVFKKMMENARRLRLQVKILPEWIDADTHEDLVALARRNEVFRLGPHTRAFLKNMDI